MKIAKPMLLILTPIGVIGGLYEGWRLAGGLVFLMAVLLAGITAAVWSLVATIRREQREAEQPVKQTPSRDQRDCRPVRR